MLSSYFFVKLVTFDIIPILLIFCSKVIIQLMCDGKKSIGFCANHSLSGPSQSRVGVRGGCLGRMTPVLAIAWFLYGLFARSRHKVPSTTYYTVSQKTRH